MSILARGLELRRVLRFEEWGLTLVWEWLAIYNKILALPSQHHIGSNDVPHFLILLTRGRPVVGLQSF